MFKVRGWKIWDQLCSSSWLKSCREVVSRQTTSAPVIVILQLKQEPRLQRAVSQISEASVECFHVSLMSRWGCLRSLVSCLSGFKGSESPNWTRPKEARSLEESRADAIRRGSKRFRGEEKKAPWSPDTHKPVQHLNVGSVWTCGTDLIVFNKRIIKQTELLLLFRSLPAF